MAPLGNYLLITRYVAHDNTILKLNNYLYNKTTICLHICEQACHNVQMKG